MKENLELVRQVYKDSEMSCMSMESLIKDLKDKDNKIKDSVEEALKGYQRFKDESQQILEDNDEPLKESGMMSKMMANMGIKKEVDSDNSDSSIADMLIKGISMGSIDMEKKISSYEGNVNKKHLKLAKDFLKFQEEIIDSFKKYL